MMNREAFLSKVESHVPQTGMAIWALGGPSTLVQTTQTTVYIDLFTGPSPIAELHKATEDIVDPAAIRRVDAVLCTHHDIDHCHEASLRPLVDNTNATLIGPCSCMKLFREWGFPAGRTAELNCDESILIGDLRIWAQPCNDYFDPDAVSYILQSGGVTLFDGGDTLYYSGYITLGKRFDIDVALLNYAANPPDEIYYMNKAQVARTAVELGAHMLIPKHYDLWQEFSDDPTPLVAMLADSSVAVRILQQGESLYLTCDGGNA